MGQGLSSCRAYAKFEVKHVTHKDWTVEERLARLERISAIGIVVALLLFGALGGYVVRTARQADARATEALQRATTTDREVTSVIAETTRTVASVAESAVRSQLTTQVPGQVATATAGLLDRLRAEIPNTVIVSPGSAVHGGGSPGTVCPTGVASGVSLTTPNADILVFCSSLSLRRQ